VSIILGTVEKQTSVPIVDLQVEILISEVLVYTKYKKIIVCCNSSLRLVRLPSLLLLLSLLSSTLENLLLYHNRCYA